jgi:chromosome segregation ATPase
MPRSRLLGTLMIVCFASPVAASEKAIPAGGELSRIGSAVERIETLLQQLLATSESNAIASLYYTTVTRISEVEERLSTLEQERRDAASALDEIRHLMEDWSAEPPATAETSDEARAMWEKAAVREGRFEQRLARTGEEIDELRAELAALRLQKKKLEERIADEI